MNILIIISIINIALYFALAILALKVWMQGKAQRRFFFLMVCTGVWLTITFLEFLLNKNITLYEFLGKLDFSFAALVAYFFLIFVIHFPKNNSRITLIKETLISLPILLLLVLIFSELIFKYDNYGKALYNVPLYITYIIVLILYFVIFGAGILIYKYKKFIGFKKLQLKYFILGYVVSIVVLLLSSIYSALVKQIPDLNLTILCNFSIIFAISTSYSILRYRLMDIRLVIKKSLAHTIALVVALMVYGSLVLVFQRVLIEQYHWSFTTAVILVVLIISLSVEPLRRLVVKSVNNIFYTKKEKIKMELLKTKVTITSIKELDKDVKWAVDTYFSVLDSEQTLFLMRSDKGRTYQSIYPKYYHLSLSSDEPLFIYLRLRPKVLIREEIPYLMEDNFQDRKLLEKVEPRLKRLNIYAVVPINLEDKLYGLFFLGPKKQSESYTKEDIDILGHLQNNVSNALIGAIMYKEAIESIVVAK